MQVSTQAGCSGEGSCYALDVGKGFDGAIGTSNGQGSDAVAQQLDAEARNTSSRLQRHSKQRA